MDGDYGKVNFLSLRVMKVKQTLWLAATVIMSATTCSAAAPPLTLSTAIAEAQEKNPEIRALSAGIESVRGAVTTARTWDNPELGVAPGIRRSQPSAGPSSSEFHGVFELKQTIEFPGKRRLRLALADKNVRIQELALTGFRNQLTTSVRRAFYTVLISRQVLGLKEQRLALAQTFVEAAHKKVAGGFAPEFEATKAEVEVVAAQKALHEARAQVVTARGALNTLLGHTPRAELELVGALNAEVAVPEEADFLHQVSTRNPSLQVQEVELERSGLSLQSARKSRFPDFIVGPSVEYLKDEQTYDFGVTLPLPLWDNKKGEIISARAEQQKAAAELEKLQQEIARDVSSAYHDLTAAKESLALYTPEFLAKLKSALDDASRSYAEGHISLIIYLETQRTYFDTQADYLDTLQKLYDAQAALETAAGMPLSNPQEKAK